MQSLNPKVRFDCEQLSKITMDGEIPSDLMRHENAELEIRYVAFWAGRFFGVGDGMVTEFQVATATPDLDGNFRVDIPDFSADEKNSSHSGGASLHFMLRNSETLSPIAINLTRSKSNFSRRLINCGFARPAPPALNLSTRRNCPSPMATSEHAVSARRTGTPPMHLSANRAGVPAER